MNVLLFLPGLLVLFFQFQGVVHGALCLLLIAVIQVRLTHVPRYNVLTCSWQAILPAPAFYDSWPHALSYFRSAFDFSRSFEHQWSINWQNVPLDVFASRRFHLALTVGHVSARRLAKRVFV